jgi:diguanylate cyclase (GGDEF)-like protein
MNSLVAIRRSIVESAASLKTCVEKMAEESRQSVAQLTAEVNEYRDRLQTSEKLSTTDPLTDLYNRRAFEHQLETFIERGRSFSLIMIDLNGFKAINDAHGHLAGDDLLRQFSLKLAAQFTANDIVARWGGDEFAILITGRLAQIEDRVSRIRRCALGEYWICACPGPSATPESDSEKPILTILTASIGVVEWSRFETGSSLLARADALVYRTKPRNR